ncbi:OLC1v1001884C1 [Oldenlandia corymbosa var. corymbosa]|uniref:OLC1v1001884C1 n=1 Tax=Oldenlandia corymbosa var. corymbosa TaxID=529605 RepID=A0AAV1D6B1_OLDCO|nr:OLC1v1001884C1 [Oldenlandia corymbosa var. corymbosa]
MASTTWSTVFSNIKSAIQDVGFQMRMDSEKCNPEAFKKIRYRLRNLITFVLCARKLGDSDQLLGSFLARIGDVGSKLVVKYPDDSDFMPDEYFFLVFTLVSELQGEIQTLEEEIEEWYVTMLQQSNPHLTTDDVSEIIGSILENVEDFFDFSWGNFDKEVEMEAFRDQLTFLINFLQFVTKQTRSAETGKDLLAHSRVVVINTAYILFMRNLGRFGQEWYEGMISELQQSIKPINPQTYETYSHALGSSKLPRQADASDDGEADADAFITIVDFLDSLLSFLWELLRRDTSYIVNVKYQLLELCEGLKSLRIILEEQQDDFDIKIQEEFGNVLCDAGILISSIYQKVIPVDLDLLELIKTIKTIQARFGEEDLDEVSIFSFPRTAKLGYINFLLERLKELTSEAETTANNGFQTIQEQLVFLRKFLVENVNLHDEPDKLQTLWDHVSHVLHKVECFIDNIAVRVLPTESSMSMEPILKDLQKVMEDVVKTSHGKRQEIEVKEVPRTYPHTPSQSALSLPNDVVGLHKTTDSITDRLAGGSNRLQTVAIVGMAGLGKTTFATKVFNDPSIFYRFQVRAWCAISQTVDRKRVFVELLNQIDGNTHSHVSEGDLVQKLWRSLKGKRYLIFLDDVWDSEAWKSLEMAFPDDRTQSRIMLTSRQHDIVPQADPYFLSPLNEEESLELLQKKLFPGNGWPPALCDLGMQIVGKCQGLPLIIVIMAGLLANVELNDWKKVLDGLGSSIKARDEQFLHFAKGYHKLLAVKGPQNLRRFCITSGPKYDVQYQRKESYFPLWREISYVIHTFKLLRVLDLEQIYLFHGFPSEVELLALLAFLAITGNIDHIPSSIAKLSNLETLIVDPECHVVSLPDSFWNLRKLKYLNVSTKYFIAGASFPLENINSSYVLHGLDRLSGPIFHHCDCMESVMKKFPNIRRLKCRLFQNWDGTENLERIMFPKLLFRLESLHISRYRFGKGAPMFGRLLEFSLPANLKKLTLDEFGLSRRGISMIGKLPNLEILKLLRVSFEEETWEMEEGEFSNLRILKLYSWGLVRWIAGDDQLGCLEKLVLNECYKLEEIPPCLKDSSTIKVIEAFLQSGHPVINLVKEIEEAQRNWGNNTELKTFIHEFM